MVRAHFLANLGGNQNFAAIAASLHPVAENGFRLAALMTRNPGRISVGGVNKIEAGGDKGVQDFEGSWLVGGPSEDVAA